MALDRIRGEIMAEVKRRKKRKLKRYRIVWPWANNTNNAKKSKKRRRNKYRLKKYPAFYPSVKFFGRLDDIITEKLEDNFKNNEYFNSFIEEKDLAVGDANVFRVSK